MGEWFNPTAWNAVTLARVSRVRISLSPPNKKAHRRWVFLFATVGMVRTRSHAFPESSTKIARCDFFVSAANPEGTRPGGPQPSRSLRQLSNRFENNKFEK